MEDSSRDIHQDLFRKEVHLPLFTVGGEFIRVIQTTFSVQLEGGGGGAVPSFPHLVCFEHCFSFIIVQGDLWPYFSWS